MQIQPYLFFEGRCEEAIEFYRKAIGAEVQMLMRFKESPEPEACPTGGGDKVMHASLRVGNTNIMASDGRCQGNPSFQGMALSLFVATAAEAERYFKALAEGGKVEMPLARTFWSESFGLLSDRFGVMWMVGVMQ